MTDDDLATLSAILGRNYTAIGWQLEGLELLSNHQGFSSQILCGKIKCPCGGREYFSSIVCETIDTTRIPDLATDILWQTASKWHIEADIANGSLPATTDIDKIAFNGVLL